MERIAIIFEAADESLEHPAEAFSGEYGASAFLPFFFPVLANLAQFEKGADLAVNRPSPIKRMHCILRTRNLRYDQLDKLRHALKRQGYDLVLLPKFAPMHLYDDRICSVAMSEPERARLHHHDKKDVWPPDNLKTRKTIPAILKFPSGKILRNPDGTPKVFREKIDKYEADKIIAEALGSNADRCIDVYLKAPLWFERYIDIAHEKDTPVEWRAYYYLDRLFYLCPKSALPHGVTISIPPKTASMTDVFWGNFYSVDYALDTNGRWWLLARREGQLSPLPSGADPTEFLQNLEREIEHGYDYPEWAWCVVGTIVPSHKIGENKVEVAGSRHFAAGQKVYVIDGYFGLGAERCTVIGRPKYSDKYVCVDMNTDFIENFTVEKVTEDVILRAIYTGRLYEPFKRDDIHIRSCWGNDDEDLEGARSFAESSNTYYRKTWTKKRVIEMKINHERANAGPRAKMLAHADYKHAQPRHCRQNGNAQ